jgi:hypothetical protein
MDKTESSVKQDFGWNNGNRIVLVPMNSWTLPITSPAIAPSIGYFSCRYFTPVLFHRYNQIILQTSKR